MFASGGASPLPAWETAVWAHGPALASWVELILTLRGVDPVQLGEARERQLRRWRTGETAAVSFWQVDRVVTGLELHPADVPDHVWGTGPRPPGGRAQVAA